MHKTQLFIFLSLCFNITAQSPFRSRATANVSYTPTDIFLQYGGACGNINHTVFIGFGVNRTIFQRRFYPEITYQYSRDLSITKKIHILPYTKCSVERLKVTNSRAHFWLNPELGMNIEFGYEKRIGFGTGYRMLNEFWKQDHVRLYSRDFGLTVNCYYIFK